MPQDVQDTLNDFTSTGVEGINISQFRETLDRNILNFNIDMQINDLTILRDSLINLTVSYKLIMFMYYLHFLKLNGTNQTADDVQVIINQLVQVNNSVNSIQNQVV